ncbi:MAG TPA: HAMP domain-containing sensor histidine kinase [Rhodomicrobium sp.]|nr:HAMP domain-containing sensor histidine kinase [Rhodomicrobium sp.]
MSIAGSVNWRAFAREGSKKQETVARRAPEATAIVNRDFAYDLLLMFVRNERVAALTVPILAIVVAVTLLNWGNPRQLLLWIATILMSEGILLALCRRFRNQPRETVDLNQWQRNLAAAQFLYGVCWAAVAFTEFHHNNEAAYFFLFAALTVVTAIRMLFAATVMPILHAGTAPVTTALALRFLMTGDAFYWIMAVVAIGIHFYFVFLVKTLHRTALSMLDYRAEKDRLIDELGQAKTASDEARIKAEAANLAKSKFLANMSHELRTPLNAIMGFSEMIKDEVLGPIGNATYKSYAGDIYESGNHLLKLINEILDLSRIEAGRYELSEKVLDLSEIAQESIKILRLDAQNKKLRLVTDFKPEMPCVSADERALRQICLNLISNAIKFTPENGVVAVRTGILPGGEAILTVRDNGPGIPDEEIPRVMSAFGQGSLALKMRDGGTGLGLPIVTGLAELHGGRFELRSKVDVGTEASVILPKSRVVPGAPQPRTQGENVMPFPVRAA